MIVKRAETLGVDWTGTMAKLQAQDWSSRIKVSVCVDEIGDDSGAQGGWVL